MSLSPPPGTSLDRTLNAAKVSECPSAWVDGLDTNATTDFMDDEPLNPNDNLSDFGLGPC
jgi:hypothetical protein